MTSLITRRRSVGLGLATLGLWLAGAAPSHAHIAFTSPGPQTGLTYEFQGSTTHGGAGSISGEVGAKSWAEPNNPVGAKGWTHTSNWVALDLSAMHEPSVLTIELARGTTGSLFPAFSLFSGFADSTSQCITAAPFSQRVKDLVGRSKAERFAGASIEQALHLGHSRGMNCSEVRAFGEEVPDQAIRVLVHPAFPRMVGRGKEDVGVQALRGVPMSGKLLAVV